MRATTSLRVLTVCILSGISAHPAHAQTLAEALDLPGGTWTTSGTPAWTPQTTGAHDGVDVVNILGPTPFVSYEYAELSTKVSGPGFIRFWWKLSNSTNAAGSLWSAREFLVQHSELYQCRCKYGMDPSGDARSAPWRQPDGMAIRPVDDQRTRDGRGLD